MKTDQLISRVRNWQEFKRAFKPLSLKEKGDAFERLTQLYLKIDPKYSTQLRNVWLLSEVPTQVSQFLNLSSKDQGIDLIVQTKAGEYWAIQCKYRESDEKSLTLREISTFISTTFTVCRNISFGLIATTANRITHKIEGAENIGFCASDVWLSLDEEFFNEAWQYLRHKSVKLTPRTPRPHQKRAIKNALIHFQKRKKYRGKLIMACGTGKSLIGYWIREALNAKTTLVAVPSLALIKQSLDDWLREIRAKGLHAEWICVCSDQTVGKPDPDAPIFTQQELGIPCHTSPKEIENWFKKTKGATRVIFTTYQSGIPLAQAAKRASATFDLGIMDEAHKTVGLKDKVFSHLLFDRNIRILKRIFMTATERRYRGDSDEILSMDDESIYGATFERLSFKEALEASPPILSDYRIITMEVTKEETEKLIRSRAFVRLSDGKWNGHLTAHDFAALVALRKAIKKHKIKHAISFHSSIERAKTFKDHQNSFTKLSPSFGRLEAFHVSGKLPTSERKKVVREFAEATPSLITNARCLTEGVDIPAVDGVLFADPKQSTIDIVQASGRALRRAKKKSLGYIIIPLLTKENATIDQIAESSEFKAVLTVLRALASNDDRIIEFFRTISKMQGRGLREQNRLVEIITTRLDTKDFVSALELKCWNRLASFAWRPFRKARSFVRGLNLKSQKQWNQYCNGEIKGKEKPYDIPNAPHMVYANNGWSGFGDWLGTGRIADQLRQYKNFKAARRFARKLGLKSGSEWRDYCKGKIRLKKPKPKDIPASPYKTYKNRGWISMGDWLGTGRIRTQDRQYRTFKSARAYVRGLNLRGVKEWQKYAVGRIPGLTKPPDIPSSPGNVYKNRGWINWGDWLGTYVLSSHGRKYMPFDKARNFARSLHLKNNIEWRQYSRNGFKGMKRPVSLPAAPDRIYKKSGWRNWGDWLGTFTESQQKRKFRTFERARSYVRKQKLKNVKEWKRYCKDVTSKTKPSDIPSNPNLVYREFWKGWGDWLGTFRLHSKKFWTFKRARTFVRKLKLTGENQWRRYCKGEFGNLRRPEEIPTNPQRKYKDGGWKGWGDWLGKGHY